MVTSLLSESGARDVEAAITRAERVTSAELVVAIIARSADHWQGRALLSVLGALTTGVALLQFDPWSRLWVVFLLEIVAGALAFAALGWPPLHRWLVSPVSGERAAHARAFQLFAERGLHGTRGRTALLIFVSELERRVVLLGDATIHAELGQPGWQAEVERLIKHIRAGQLREGLLEVIAELEPRLARVAPPGPDDKNELPDRVLRN